MYKVLIIPADTEIIVQKRAFTAGDKVRQFEAINSIDVRPDVAEIEAVDQEGRAILLRYDNSSGKSVTKWTPMSHCRVIEV